MDMKGARMMGETLQDVEIDRVSVLTRRRCFRRSIPVHLRDDCVQEALAIAVVIARDYPRKDFPRLMSRCIARGISNAMRAWFGQQGRKPQGIGLSIDAYSTSDPRYAEIDIRLTLETVTESLPEKDRGIIAFMQTNDLNYRQIAYRLGFTKAQVSHAVERTREQWRK